MSVVNKNVNDNIISANKNESYYSGYKEIRKYCLYHNVFINGCKDTHCPLHPCTFASIHKQIREMFREQYNISRDEACRIARVLLLNSYNPRGKT